MSLDIPQKGEYTFFEDSVSVEKWDGFEANWEQLAGVEIVPKLIDCAGGSWVARNSATEGKSRWTVADFVPAPGAARTGGPRAIFRVGWQVKATQKAAPVLKSCQLLLPHAAGTGSFTLFADHSKPYPTFVPPVAADDHPPVSAAGNAPRVFVAESSLLMARPEWAQAIVPWANAKFPNTLGVDMGSLLWSGMKPELDSYRKAAHASLMFESNSIGTQLAFLRNNHLSVTRSDGFTPSQPIWPTVDMSQIKALVYHEEDTTQPAVLEVARERMFAAFDLGFDSYLLVDYVWPYFGGRWGFGDAALTCWKKMLEGQGPAIDLVGPDETWHFADYWKHFQTIPYEPREFGYANWGEFVPVETREASSGALGVKRLRLFNALWHFQYLVYADQLGRAAESRQREFAISVNPEDTNNGTDYSLLARLKHLGSIGIEFFGNPMRIEAWRHTLPWLRYRTGGPKIDIIGEINSGGHGASRYDRETAFAFYYEATSTTWPRFYNAQYQESLWQAQPTVPAGQLDRFNHWYGGARAFLLRRAEATRLREVRPSVTVVASRSVLESVRGSTSSLAQEGNLAHYLHTLNIDFEQVGRDMWSPEQDDHTKVLFFCPAEASGAAWRALTKWISTGTGKTLVLHGPGAWRDDTHIDHFTPLPSAIAPLIAPKAEETIHLQSAPLNTSIWDLKVVQKTLLKSDENIPLVTAWQVGGNRVLHIQAKLDPLQISPVGLQIVAVAASECGITPFAQPAADWSIDRWSVPGGDVAVLWNTSELKSEDAKNYYARVPLAKAASVALQVIPGQKYTLYSLFDDRGWQQTSGANGQLLIPLTSSKEIIYYGSNNRDLAASMQAARQAYQDLK